MHEHGGLLSLPFAMRRSTDGATLSKNNDYSYFSFTGRASTGVGYCKKTKQKNDGVFPRLDVHNRRVAPVAGIPSLHNVQTLTTQAGDVAVRVRR